MSAPPIRMRKRLGTDEPAPVWPPGHSLAPFMSGDIGEIHALLVLAYSRGGGTVTPAERWGPALVADPEFDPALVFVAKDAAGRIVGLCQCWTGGFIKDLVVHPDARRIGLGEALLRAAFRKFAARGFSSVDLKVEADNPSGARRLYERVGMIAVER